MKVSDTPLKNVDKVLSYRQLDIFKKLLFQYPEFFVKSDLVIYLALLSIWISNILDELDLSLDNIDVDTADESSLKKLAYIVGYTWSEALPLNTNRSRIKYYMYRKKYRGTIDSLKNLIKTGYGEEGFFSNRANNSIDIIENSPQIIVTVTDNEDTVILRDNIEEVRPAGTVLRFLYQFTLGFIDMVMTESVAWTLSNIKAEPSYYDIDTLISEWYSGPDSELGGISGLPILDFNTSMRYLVDMSDDPYISHRPDGDKDPIIVNDYDNLGLLVGKYDYFYKMYTKEHDDYFNYIKPKKDEYVSIEFISDGSSFDDLSNKCEILAVLGNTSVPIENYPTISNPIIPEYLSDIMIRSVGSDNTVIDSFEYSIGNELRAILDPDEYSVYDIIDFSINKLLLFVGKTTINSTNYMEYSEVITDLNNDYCSFAIKPINIVDNSYKGITPCYSTILKGYRSDVSYLSRTENSISTYIDDSAMFVGTIKKSDLVDNSVLKLFRDSPIDIYYRLSNPIITDINKVDHHISTESSTLFRTISQYSNVVPSKSYLIASWDWSGKFK